MNDGKTQKITFSLRHLPKRQDAVSEVGVLGVTLDAGLTWQSHVAGLSSRLSKTTYLIRNLARCVSSGTLRAAYFGYFHSAMTELGSLHSCR